MFHLLPFEIVYHIIEIAAEECVASDNVSDALRLALVSRDIRAVVIPIAYHTLFITERNSTRLAALAKQSAHPLSAVRHVFVRQDVHEDDAALILAACPSVTRIDASSLVILHLAVRPQRVVLCCYWLLDAEHFPATLAQGITHIKAGHMRIDPADASWVPALLAALPALTHVVLDVCDFHRVRESLDSLVPVVAALLQRPQLQRIVLHIYDTCAQAWAVGDCALRVAQLRDARVLAWVDRRLYRIWSDEERLCMDDLRSGHDVWNSGERICHA